MRDAAGGGDELSWEQMGEDAYDWSGIFTRSGGGLSFDPDIPASGGAVTAQLTEAGQAAVDAKIRQIEETGGEYDRISDCSPPGVPRWLTEPFLHEFIVTPDQTWLINEMVNDVRRVYTDGRGHTPEADAYPTWNGDTVGFWDGDMLVMHTAYLMPGNYQRGIQPDYSDQVDPGRALEENRRQDRRGRRLGLRSRQPGRALVHPPELDRSSPTTTTTCASATGTAARTATTRSWSATTAPASSPTSTGSRTTRRSRTIPRSRPRRSVWPTRIKEERPNEIHPQLARRRLAVAATTLPVLAHHSSAMFDDEKEVTVEGTVKEFQYTNPHSWLLVDVKNDDGTTTTWGFEAEGPSTLLRAGIRKSDFEPGDEISITGHPMRDGRPAAAWLKAKTSDGTEVNPRAGFAIN